MIRMFRGKSPRIDRNRARGALGVVLGGEPMQTAWLPRPAVSGGTLVRWVFGESEAEFMGWLQAIPDAILPNRRFVPR